MTVILITVVVLVKRCYARWAGLYILPPLQPHNGGHLSEPQLAVPDSDREQQHSVHSPQPPTQTALAGSQVNQERNLIEKAQTTP